MQSTSKKSTPNEVVSTYSRLLNQSKTTKLASWSSLSLERAIGWADSMEKVKKRNPKEERPKVALLKNVLMNPCCPTDLVSDCEKYFQQLGVEGVETYQKVVKAKSTAEKTCREELPKRLKRLQLTEEELVKRAAAKELEKQCDQNESLRTLLETRALSEHAWYMEALIRIASWAPSEHWVWEMIIKTKPWTKVDQTVLKECCENSSKLSELCKIYQESKAMSEN